MRRVDGYMSRKAQETWATAVVFCYEDFPTAGHEKWILERSGGFNGFSDELALGTSFKEAKAALIALMSAEAARRMSQPQP